MQIWPKLPKIREVGRKMEAADFIDIVDQHPGWREERGVWSCMVLYGVRTSLQTGGARQLVNDYYQANILLQRGV